MAKREIEPEAMDEELVETGAPTVGERLRAAREEKKISLEDIAAQTRIPAAPSRKHRGGRLGSLPAPTYTVGFAKSYASSVGLDRTEIGEQLREEMGGQRFAAPQAEVFEAADPARTMPKWLVFGAIAAVILLIVIMSWLNQRSLDQTEEPAAAACRDGAGSGTAAAAPLRRRFSRRRRRVRSCSTATGPPWIQVNDRAGELFQGVLTPGQTYAVPPTAIAPVLKAGKPEALRITVGTPSRRQSGRRAGASNVSLQAGRSDARPAAAGARDADSAAPHRLNSCIVRFHLPGKPPAGQDRRTTPKRGDFVISQECDYRSLRPSAAIFFLAIGRDGAAAAADARPASRAARKADAADPAPGFSKGRPADTAGFSDDPAATQSSVLTLDQRLDALERQVTDMLRQTEENGNRLQSLQGDLGRLRTDQEQRISTIEQRMNDTSAVPTAVPAGPEARSGAADSKTETGTAQGDCGRLAPGGRRGRDRTASAIRRGRLQRGLQAVGSRSV